MEALELSRKKERSFCAHCNFHGHSIDKCYKIYGYPQGYKPRQRDSFQNASRSNSINQVSTSFVSQNEDKEPGHGLGSFVQNLSLNQYQQLMSMLSTYLSSSSNTIDQQDNATTSYIAGICSSISMHPIFSSKDIWIVDSGATRHICSIATAFMTLRIIDNSTITLPNHTQIPVRLSGDIRLSPNLVLQNVLFVLQFKYNFLFVSALTCDSRLTISFFLGHFIIQETNIKKMTGRGDQVQDLYVLDTKVLNSASNAYVNNVSIHV